MIALSSGAPFTPLVAGNAPQAATVRVQTGVLGAGGTNRLPQTERNSYRLPYTANMDLRVSRAFPVGRNRFEVSFEAFNLFNRTNYTAANTTLYTIGGTVAAPTLVYNAATFNTFHEREQRHLLSQTEGDSAGHSLHVLTTKGRRQRAAKGRGLKEKRLCPLPFLPFVYGRLAAAAGAAEGRSVTTV